MNEYEVAPREAYIAEALEVVARIGQSVTLDAQDVAAFIEGYLQGKEAGGKL